VKREFKHAGVADSGVDRAGELSAGPGAPAGLFGVAPGDACGAAIEFLRAENWQ